MNYFQLLLLLFGVLFVIIMTVTVVLICASYCEKKFFPEKLKSNHKIMINNKSYNYTKTPTGITLDNYDDCNTPALNFQISQMMNANTDYCNPGHYLTGDYSACHAALDFGAGEAVGDFGFSGDMGGCD